MPPERSENSPGQTATRILRAWRRLAGGTRAKDADRRTLLACSGGADSSALVWAIASVRPADVVVAHVIHDLRAEPETHADRDAARDLADRLAVPFAETSVRIADTVGNAERAAREARYAALGALAGEHACPYIATGHHAEDQLETVLMALVRGAGPRGLGGMRPSRRLASGQTLIRPMLGVTRADAVMLCEHAGIEWREDETNQDTTRARASLRTSVIPELLTRRPGLGERLISSSALCHAAADMLRARGDRLLGRADGGSEGYVWTRAELRRASEAVLGEALRLGVHRLSAGVGVDRLSYEVIDRAVRAARSRSGEARRLILGPCVLTLIGQEATLSRRAAEETPDG